MTTNYSREWVENAPVRRFSFFDLVNAAPGVSASTSTSSRSQSFGSATNENVYLIDGTDFTAPLTGAAWPWPNTDAIEEIQVLSLGAPADYGNLGGAVFNVVTRQGSNTFHGDANFYFQTQGLTGRNTTDAQDNKQPYHRDEFKDTTLQIPKGLRVQSVPADDEKPQIFETLESIVATKSSLWPSAANSRLLCSDARSAFWAR